MKNDRHRGIALILCSGVCFALMGVFVRLTGDIPSFQKSFFRNIVSLIFSSVLLWKKKVPLRCPRESMLALGLRCGFGTVALLSNFYALDHLLLADASILNKLDPFFCILFSAIFLAEGFTPFQALAVAGAFAGSLLIIKPTFANLNLYPSMIGFLGGVCAGASMTALRSLGRKKVSPPVIVFSFSLVSTLVTLPYLIVVHHPMALWQVGLLVCAGLAATGGQFSVTAAYRCAPASEISVYTYSQVMVSALLGFFLFDQIPDGFSFVGYLIVCAMAVILFFYNRRRAASGDDSCPVGGDDLGL